MVALLAALLTAASPDSHGRLVVGAAAGGGWTSDPYVGAELEGGPMAELVPTARLDLSLSRRVKIAAGVEASWLRFRAGDFEARALGAGGEVRLVRRAAEAALGIHASAEHYPTGAPSGEGAAGPVVSRSAELSATPAVRARSGAWRGWASVAGHVASSRTASDDVGEQGLAPAAGLSWTGRDGLVASGSGRLSRVWSGDDAFAFRAAELEAVVAARPLGALDVLVRGGLHHTRFDTGVVEDLVSAGLEATHPVGPVTAVVAWSGAWSDAGSLGKHGRQLVWLGLRAQLGVASW
jgi:hypothetical protein